MKLLEKFEAMMQKLFNPIAQKVGGNKVLQAIAQGCLSTVPITIGIALVSVLVNLNMGGWGEFLEKSGLYKAGQEAISVTMSLLAVYLLVTISYSYSKLRGYSNLIATMLSMAVFLIQVPSTLTLGDDQTITALTSDYLGSNGIFVAILISIITTAVYCTLMDKGMKLKLPKAVPPMVADSISSCIPALLIITVAVLIKLGFTFTPFENLFSLITTIIQIPFMQFGTSPMAYIIFTVFCNLLWFCGIHPAAITSVYTPVIIGAIIANTEAFTSGSPLPYAAIIIVYLTCSIGGNGCTLGFCGSLFLAKSERLKALRKIVVIPNIFNINEPIIFGVPLMLNPYYFLPMLLTPIVNGLVSWGIFQLLQMRLNPTFVLGFPWVTPGVIVDFFVGGILFALIWIVCVILDFVIYLPFTVMDDKAQLIKEQEFADTDNTANSL